MRTQLQTKVKTGVKTEIGVAIAFGLAFLTTSSLAIINASNQFSTTNKASNLKIVSTNTTDPEIMFTYTTDPECPVCDACPNPRPEGSGGSYAYQLEKNDEMLIDHFEYWGEDFEVSDCRICDTMKTMKQETVSGYVECTCSQTYSVCYPSEEDGSGSSGSGSSGSGSSGSSGISMNTYMLDNSDRFLID